MAGRPPTPPADHARAQILARRIRHLREERGWTRERLAKEAQIHTRTLVRLESEGAVQPSFFTVGALATALGVTLDSLYAETHQHVGLWSIGYEGRTLDSFLTALKEAHIDAVADVRLTPISRKPGFSKKRLGAALAEMGVQYHHFRSLGNPKDNRAPFWEGRLAEGRDAFRRALRSEEAARQLDELAALANRERVAVFCFEHDEHRCHRQVVLETIGDRTPGTVTPLAS